MSELSDAKDHHALVAIQFDAFAFVEDIVQANGITYILGRRLCLDCTCEKNIKK